MTDNTQKSQISISVVVPCLNAGQFIGQALGALLAQEFTGSYEIVVADNGSSDNTRSIVKEMQQTHANIRLVDAADRRAADDDGGAEERSVSQRLGPRRRAERGQREGREGGARGV